MRLGNPDIADFIHLHDRARQIGARLAALFFAPTGAEKHPLNRAGQVVAGDDPARALRPAADAGGPPVVAEIVGTIVRLTDPVTPARAGVYRDAYFHVEYRVERVLRGDVREPIILTVQPCLKDRKPLPSAGFVKGERHRMKLALWERIPGWETQLIGFDDQQDLDAVRYIPVHTIVEERQPGTAPASEVPADGSAGLTPQRPLTRRSSPQQKREAAA